MPARQLLGQRVELDDVGARRPEQFGVFGVAEAERLSRRERNGDPFGCAVADGVLRDSTVASATCPPAAATTPGRSTCAATSEVIASTAARAWRPCSTAVTRPRCREGTVNSSIRGNAPSTGTPACSHAWRSTSSWRGEPTRLRITPAIRVESSNVAKPCSSAAMLWLCPVASTTRITGAPSSAATCAVDPGGRTGHGGVDASVEQPHHAFDHGDVAAVAAVPVQRSDQFVADQHRVEVAAGPARRQRVIARVDVVGADLERRDPMSRLPQRTDQTRCHRGLSAARGGRGDHDGRTYSRHSPFPASRRVSAHDTPQKTGHFAPARAIESSRVTTRCPSGPCGLRPSGA